MILLEFNDAEQENDSRVMLKAFFPEAKIVTSIPENADEAPELFVQVGLSGRRWQVLTMRTATDLSEYIFIGIPRTGGMSMRMKHSRWHQERRKRGTYSKE